MRLTILLLCSSMTAACTDSRTAGATPGGTGSSRDAPQVTVPSAGRRLGNDEVTPSAAAAAREILLQHHGSPLGTEVPFEVEGKLYVARIEQHYAPPGQPGRPQGLHKGVTLYEPARR